MTDPTQTELEAMGGWEKCPFCGAKHATKKQALACTGKRRAEFAELDALVAKISTPKTPPA